MNTVCPTRSTLHKNQIYLLLPDLQFTRSNHMIECEKERVSLPPENPKRIV